MKLLLFIGFLALTVIEGAEVASLGAPPGGRVQHRVAGRVSFLNPTTIRVDDFTYDGTGIRVYFYFYRPGGAQSGRGGTIIRANGNGDGRIERRAYNSEDLQITMPSGTDVCDIQTLTVWCDPFDAIFAQVTVDRSQVFSIMVPIHVPYLVEMLICQSCHQPTLTTASPSLIHCSFSGQWIQLTTRLILKYAAAEIKTHRRTSTWDLD